jgi:hypothetical protein
VEPDAYLLPEKAIHGGHYSAIAHSSLVGLEGGNVLVEKTMNIINFLWKQSN